MDKYEAKDGKTTINQVVIYEITLDQQMILLYPELDEHNIMTYFYRDVIDNGKTTKIVP